jgi:hypothetical protein
MGPAMGATDKFADSQTGLTYSVYKPSNTLGLKTTKFSLLACQPGQEDWIFVQYGGTKRYLQIMQTMGGVKCSDPGLSKYLRAALVNGNKAKVSFSQVYESDNFKGNSRKSMELTKQGGRWMITRETVN